MIKCLQGDAGTTHTVFLQDGDAEHEDRVVRGVAAFVLALAVAEDAEKPVAEEFEIDAGLKFVEGAGLFSGQVPGVLDLGEEVFLSGGGLLEAHTRILVVQVVMSSGWLSDVP